MAQKLAFIGFGGVGQGLVEILQERSTSLRESFGLDAQVVAVSDVMKGAVYHPEGLDMDILLKTVRETGGLQDYPDTPGLIRGWDSLQTIRESNADTIIEVTFTDVKTGQPAIDHCRAAFESGKNVMTTNKGPVALAYRSLQRLADEHGVHWGFEGTVMSGTPSLRMPQLSLSGNRIGEIRGILNGTTNYILTRMEEGLRYEDALAEAQEKGFAEADPTSDVEGYDVLYKVVILAQVIMGVPLTTEDVSCQGMTDLTVDDIRAAKAEGKRWKLLARIRQTESGVQASVAPEKLAASDPLAGVEGATNAVTYDCDLSGPITLLGAGAGRMETGFSLLIDLINLGTDKQKTLTVS